MNEQYGNAATGTSQPGVNGTYTPAPMYNSTGPDYGSQPPYSQPPYGTGGPYGAPPPATGGLSDTAAGALAYVTILPAIIFLVMAPYNQKPFVKFHAFQCLGLAVAWICLGVIGIIPILGWIVLLFGAIAMLVVWIICVIKASQGGAFKLPVIGNFAAQQSGYMI